MVDLDADAHQYRLDEIKELKAEIKRLSECLKEANKKIEHFEREWYLAVDCVETLSTALDECANQHRAIWSLAVKEQKGETTVSPYALAQITWAASENARAALAGEKKYDAR